MPNKPIFFKSYGSPKASLTPSWQSLKKLESGSDFTPQPTISEVGGGWYKYDIALSEKLVGVIDGGSEILVASERYKDVLLDNDEKSNEVIVIPVYNENSDVLTVIVMLHRNGRLVTADLTNCSVVFYDKTGVSLFTLTSTSFTNGVTVMTKSIPNFSENEVYYCVATITCDSESFVSADTFVTLE